MERVTEKVKDPKKVVTGRAGAAARKAKQEEQLLEQLRVAKESFRPPAGDDTSANIPPKEAAAVSQTERREALTNWTPWVVWACRRGAHVFRSAQTRRPASAAPVDSAPKQPAPGARQLKTRDPFYMEWVTMTPATDGKVIVNTLYHSAVVSGLAMGYARLGKMAMGGGGGGSLPKLDFTPRDVGMVALDVALAMGTKDVLIKQGIIPADIMK